MAVKRQQKQPRLTTPANPLSCAIKRRRRANEKKLKRKNIPRIIPRKSLVADEARMEKRVEK